MSARAFSFQRGDFSCFAQGESGRRPIVHLCLAAGLTGGIDIVITTSPTAIRITSPLTPAEARAMANALEAAATHSENTLATGLGESVVDA